MHLVAFLFFWRRSVRLCAFQVAGLQYKKFLAFPWILTVTWPMDTVSTCSLYSNIIIIRVLLVKSRHTVTVKTPENEYSQH